VEVVDREEQRGERELEGGTGYGGGLEEGMESGVWRGKGMHDGGGV
jgi:hypothetical protein